MTQDSTKNDSPEQQGGFVPASLQTAHYSRSNGYASGDSSYGPSTFNQYSRAMADYSNRKPTGMRTGAKVAIAFVIAALIAGVAGLAFFVFKETQKQAINEDLHDVSREVMQAIDNELTGMTTFDEPFTILLLGTDEREGEDEEDIGARTDTIVLCRVDPSQNIISMMSIPRDTMVQLSGVGTAKINAAYTYGGPGGTIAAVRDLTGVDIDHYAQVNFFGLMDLVDAIGGIDVYVDELIDDPDASDDIVIPEGEQHLDGAQALVFARSRAYTDGDFTRVSNQRKVIEAIVHKGLEAPASELYGLIQASTSFLTTDTAMDVDFIYSLADQIRHNNDYPVQLYSATIPASTAMVDGVSYVIADQAGLADMVRAFLMGEDISALATEPVIDNTPTELREVGGNASGGSGYGYGNGAGYGSGGSTGYGTGYSN